MYGNFTTKQEWKSFMEGLPIKTTFLHKDEFEKRYNMKVLLPAVFISIDRKIKKLVTRMEIETRKSLKELEKLAKQKKEAHVQHHHSNL